MPKKGNGQFLNAYIFKIIREANIWEEVTSTNICVYAHMSTYVIYISYYQNCCPASVTAFLPEFKSAQ
jgi:hypothetical protein